MTASSARWPTASAGPGGRWGLAAMCVGVGQRTAVVLDSG